MNVKENYKQIKQGKEKKRKLRIESKIEKRNLLITERKRKFLCEMEQEKILSIELETMKYRR